MIIKWQHSCLELPFTLAYKPRSFGHILWVKLEVDLDVGQSTQSSVLQPKVTQYNVYSWVMVSMCTSHVCDLISAALIPDTEWWIVSSRPGVDYCCCCISVGWVSYCNTTPVSIPRQPFKQSSENCSRLSTSAWETFSLSAYCTMLGGHSDLWPWSICGTLIFATFCATGKGWAYMRDNLYTSMWVV